ncbi:MAG: hypothetical protein WD510_00675 [Balneolaceae bacterium]
MWKLAGAWILLGLQAVLFLPAHAQIQPDDSPDLPEEVEFGGVPDSLFGIQPEHGFPYEYLRKTVDVSFSDENGNIVAYLDYLVRIKVYSDEPIEWAEAGLIGIPFYAFNDMERVTGLEAMTHQPDGSREHLNREEVSTVDLNSRYKIREFMMPGVRQGSVIEYRYRKSRRYIEELPDFYFSHRVPTRLASLTLHNVNYLRYEVVPENINFEMDFIEQRIDTSSIPLVFSYQRPEPLLLQHWIARDVPAVENFSYISTIDDLRGKLKFQISEFGRPRQPLENSWEFVEAQIRRGENNPFEHAARMNELLKLGQSISEELNIRTSIRDSIFHLVNSRMVYNEMQQAFPGEEPEYRVLEGEPSNQADINMTLLAMLRGAGLDAWPVFLSGRNSGRINKDFPSVYQFNQMLVYLDTESGGRLMDASFAHSRPGLIPVNSYNETGMLFREDGYEWIDIRPEYSVFDLDVNIEGRLTAEGHLAGKLVVETEGYPARQIRSELDTGKPVANIIADAFFDAYGEIEFRSAEIREIVEGEFPLRVTAEFEIPSYAISFQDGLQFRPMIVGYLHRNPFEENERTAPVTLDAPEKLNIRYRIQLPDDFRVEERSQSRMTRTRGASLREDYNVSAGSIEYRYDVNIERREYSADEYSQVKSLYDRWVYLSNDEWYITQ